MQVGSHDPSLIRPAGDARRTGAVGCGILLLARDRRSQAASASTAARCGVGRNPSLTPPLSIPEAGRACAPPSPEVFVHPIPRLVPLDQLKPHPRNARTHSRKQIRAIADSIAAFGFTNPVLTDENLTLLAGHRRLEAARLLGLAEVPAIVLEGLSEARKRALLLADNKLAQRAGWDRERLALELPELAELLVEDGLEIAITGFEPVEIDQIAA